MGRGVQLSVGAGGCVAADGDVFADDLALLPLVVVRVALHVQGGWAF